MNVTNTPLHNAARSGNAETVRLLLFAGYDPNEVNAEGLTPLHIALQSGHVEIAALLIERGKKSASTNSQAEKMFFDLVIIGRRFVCGILIVFWGIAVCLTLGNSILIIDMINNVDEYAHSMFRPGRAFAGFVFIELGLLYVTYVTGRKMHEGGLTWIMQNGVGTFIKAVLSSLLKLLIK